MIRNQYGPGPAPSPPAAAGGEGAIAAAAASSPGRAAGGRAVLGGWTPPGHGRPARWRQRRRPRARRPGEAARYWRHAAVPGVDLLRARYVTHRYARHAHETYTLALIEAGVEEFRHDGSLLRAGPGAVALLNPEVVHTGHAGIPEGWSYRVLYPAVSVVRAISAELGGGHGTPRFRETVVADPRSARLVRAAHRAAEQGDPLASASLLHAALAGLLRQHAGVGPPRRPAARPPGRAPGGRPAAGAAHRPAQPGRAGRADRAGRCTRCCARSARRPACRRTPT